MRMKQQLLLASLLLTLNACKSRTNDEIVNETYVHRYGVELPRADWEARGQDGCVRSVRKDGVMISTNFEAGVLHGEMSYTFPHSSVVQLREYYDRGCLTRDIQYFTTGTPYQETVYTAPSQRTVTTWYDNGVPQAHETYNDNDLMEAEYFTTTNHKESSVSSGNGYRLKRDRFGQMISRDEIQDGQLVTCTTYHSNGSPQSVTPCENGVPHGSRMTYHPDGAPDTIENMHSGYQTGLTTVFENGEKYAEVPYKAGNKHGVERIYRDGSSLVGEVTWANGQKHGPSHSYVENQVKTDWYYQGKSVSNKSTFEAMKSQDQTPSLPSLPSLPSFPF